MAWSHSVIAVLVIGIFLAWKTPAVLDGLDSNHNHGPLELQMIVSAFCLSPVVGDLLAEKKTVVNENDAGEYSFEKEGDISNDEYAQSSIYAVLYAMYKNAGQELVSEHGVKYQFTFNTWGFAPSPYPKEDPERFGKSAYHNLVIQPPAAAYKEALGDKPLEIVEIGCGTAAGANLITREVHTTANYLALDMQQAAIDTCNERHATPDNAGLTCQIVPNGVGRGNPVPKPDNSVDFVVISETHIADIRIGEIEKDIFKEITRILKPGGLFLWGNALPTRVWADAAEYLPSLGFELVHEANHTAGAIEARDLDKPRVDLAISQLVGGYPVMKVPYFGPRCEQVSERLIANFYRHPGTALYEKMVTGIDSYMHQAWKLNK